MTLRPRSATASPHAPDRIWLALAGLILVVAFTGGGSRSDIASLPFLRAGAVLFAMTTLALVPASTWRDTRGALVLLGLLALWMIIQLIPLPVDMWSSLPLRDRIFRIDQILGANDRSRPISLAPSMTLNSLLALTVPAAALVVAAATPPADKIRIWWLIWAFGLLSSLFGLAQLATGPGSAFYLYRITNEASIVGMFSNRNHFVVLLSMAILAAGWLISNELMRRNGRTALIALFAGSIFLFLFLILAVGSRLGLICGFVGAAATLFIVRWRIARRPMPINQPTRRAAATRAPRRIALRLVLGLLPVAILVGTAALFYLSDQENAVTRLVDGSGSVEMRVAAFGTVTDLAQAQWLWGAGFGSFGRVFQIVEPDALLQPNYLNHAHNDWLQLPIEGGLPAMLIGAAAIAWIAQRLVSLIFRRKRSGDAALTEALFLALAFVFLAFGSIVDYPLRTPSIALVAALLVVLLIRCGGSRVDQPASVL
jgi:hypothetical protein